MLRKVEVTDPGDSRFLRGEQADWRVVWKTNERVGSRRQASGPSMSRMLLGITKASLVTDSLFRRRPSRKPLAC